MTTAWSVVVDKYISTYVTCQMSRSADWAFDRWLTGVAKILRKSRFLIVVSQTSARLTVERESRNDGNVDDNSRPHFYRLDIPIREHRSLFTRRRRWKNRFAGANSALARNGWVLLRLPSLQIIISLFPTSCNIYHICDFFFGVKFHTRQMLIQSNLILKNVLSPIFTLKKL